MLSQYQVIPQRMGRSMIAVGMLLTVLATSAFAQALDTPSISQTGGGFFRIDIDVHAGATGAPHGFVVQWMTKSNYDLFGFPRRYYLSTRPEKALGEPALWEMAEQALAEALRASGIEYEVKPGGRSASYLLDPSGVIGVQMGDLFDETGVNGSYLDQMPPGYYAVRVWAEGDGVDPNSGSLASSVVIVSTLGKPECTQGFWKTHGSGACDVAAPHVDVWPPSCLPMTLGTVSYTEAELCAIYNTPANGNGLISLAHQLITAKLNGCNGSDLTPIAGTIAAADAQIGGLVIPPVGGGFLSPGSTSANTQTLDDYNNGIIPGVVACATPTRHTTWGRVKALYH